MKRCSLSGPLVLAVLHAYVLCTCSVGVALSRREAASKSIHEHSDDYDLQPWRALRVNMTLCHDKCETGCKEYLLPGRGKCYNAQKLFPGDRQWGIYDVRDICTKVPDCVEHRCTCTFPLRFT